MLARSSLRSMRILNGARNGTTAAAKRSISGFGASTESPMKLNMAAAASTALAIGSVAWYYHLYGPTAHAMTPAEEGLHPTKYPWVHEQWFKTFDHQALRRGFQVYQEVCMACHSLSRIPYRSLVGTILTVDEAKALAEENEYDSEPNDEGEIEKRPGKLSDYIPAPYKNDEAARAANNGALPPDLSLIIKGRHGGCDYVFSLLTGYPEEPPAGAQVGAGLNFNPYFPGTGIAMARVLYDGLVEYEDETPATTSQMAKDVVEFLNWAAEPEMDDRKRMGMKVLAVTSVLFALSVWVKRYKWASLKSRKIVYDPPKVSNTTHVYRVMFVWEEFSEWKDTLVLRPEHYEYRSDDAMDSSRRTGPLPNANTRPIDASNDFMFGFDVEDDDDKEYLAEVAMYRIGHEDDIKGFIHLSLLRGAEEWDQAICCATAMKARGFSHDSLDGQDVLTFLAKFSSVYNSSHATTILSPPEKPRRPRAKRKSKRTCLSPSVELQLDIPVNKQRKVQDGKGSPYWDKTRMPVRQQDSRSNDGPETTRTAKKAPMKFKGSLERAVSPTPTAPIESPGDDTVVQTYRGSDSELTPITLDGQHELRKSTPAKPIALQATGETCQPHKNRRQNAKQSRHTSTPQQYLAPRNYPKAPKKRPPRGTVSSLPFPRLDAPRFGLIQEELAHDPFRLLIAVTFLVRTSGKAAIPVFHALMAKYPTPSALATADAADIVAMIKHLGLGSVRAAAIQRYARVWLEDPPRNGVRHAVKNYHGAESPRTDEHGVLVCSGGDSAWEIGHMTQGPYALDSWRIFCRDVLRGAAEDWKGGGREGEFQPEWMRVLPQDKELRAYLRWMWMQEGWQWDPRTGEKVVLSEDLRRAVAEGRVGYDDTGDLRILDHAD
ncbi:hypothetical protein EKO27_g1662 [Xylaria grammica]|uniref:quinol--cytochrome-c reductase n=1 Tax=Xylaria grammica TaxID=363999 RepID=A0A439DGE9_9PEZI|nr:hypothetical protein EKO27_g1662 [Xylaria grammica]